MITNEEYEITEEILAPDSEFRDLSPKSLDDLKIQTGAFQVTPSAMVLPARRLGMLNRDEAD